MIKVIDRYGVERDANENPDVKFPMAMVQELISPKDSPTANKELRPIMKASRLFGDVAEVYNDEGTEVLHRVKDGKGLFRVLPDGSERQIKDTSLEKGGNKTPYFGQHQIKIYTGFICTLMPHLGKVYLNDDGLDINHCIIPSIGEKSPAIYTEFFEIVNRSRNSLHGKFVKKYDLYDCPVSALDIERLKEKVFSAYGVDHPEEDPVEDPELDSIPQAFENRDAIAIKRKLITWWYFLKHHTEMTENMWNVFKDWLSTVFTGSIDTDNTKIQQCIEKYIQV